MHKAAVGTSWGEKSPAQIEDITTYSVSPTLNSSQLFIIFGTDSPSQEQLESLSNTQFVVTTNESQNIAENQKITAFDELPQINNVFGLYLANEVTGFDTATSLTPHGILENG